MGKLAKTDRVDAWVLAEMGRKLGLKPTPPVDAERVRLSDLVARRAALAAMIRAGKNRAGATRDAWLSKAIALLIKTLEGYLAAVEETVASLIDRSPQLSSEARRLRTVPGLGPALVAVIRAFRKRLEAAGKPPKLAITACARKLLTLLNAMLRDGQDYTTRAA